MLLGHTGAAIGMSRYSSCEAVAVPKGSNVDSRGGMMQYLP